MLAPAHLHAYLITLSHNTHVSSPMDSFFLVLHITTTTPAALEHGPVYRVPLEGDYVLQSIIPVCH